MIVDQGAPGGGPWGGRPRELVRLAGELQWEAAREIRLRRSTERTDDARGEAASLNYSERISARMKRT